MKAGMPRATDLPLGSKTFTHADGTLSAFCDSSAVSSWADANLIRPHTPVIPFDKRGCQDKYLPCVG